jgi:NTE family protein
MREIIERLSDLPFFKSFRADSLRLLAERGSWFSLTGGSELFRQGETADSLYFVLSGRLIVVREGDAHDANDVVGYVRSGEPVGEQSVLVGETHSASVYALRDTELLGVSRSDAHRLLAECPCFGAALARAIAHRARHPRASFLISSPRVFALISSSPSIDIETHAKDLRAIIARYGKRAVWIGDTETLAEGEFEDIEDAHDVVILTARVGETFAYRFALRHADRFFVFARRDARPPRPFPLSPSEESPARKFRLVDVAMLHEGRKSGGVADWVDAVDAHRVFQISGPRTEERLGRAIAGRTVALVLSGGGARAYAHIGAVKALRERKVPIDFVSGASMGAIIAACVAMGWDDAEIEARIRDGFVDSNPLGDHVLPVVALTRGRRVEERLKRHFGDVMIEDLDIPFFCVSSELTRGAPCVHRRGLLRDALRASIAIPGILPPVVRGGDLLVDGAVMNNFPTDLMANMHRGVTVGVDVAQEGTISPDAFVDPPSFLQWVAEHGFSSAPPIVSLLMRTATARQELRHDDSPADILIAPKVPGVQLRDWKLYDLAVADGYATTKAELDAKWDRLSAIIDPDAR